MPLAVLIFLAQLPQLTNVPRGGLYYDPAVSGNYLYFAPFYSGSAFAVGRPSCDDDRRDRSKK